MIYTSNLPPPKKTTTIGPVQEREKKIERGTKRKQDTTAEREKPYKDACGEDDLFDGLKYDKIVPMAV